tara:strand:+ start:489 stop:1982 length:1494 start_codon:yes stop_codon:yes gene_type:complete
MDFKIDTIKNDPSAGASIENYRQLGYTLNSAISDLIDNSITAKAKKIWIDFSWDKDKPWISISDDGIGMNSDELVQAMKMGSKSLNDERQKNDLGRFGCGMKTASISQARRFTVVSKTQKSELYGLTWDVDHVVNSNSWEMLIPSFAQDDDILRRINKIKSGTTLMLENLDKLDLSNQSFAERYFYNSMESLQKHVGTFFHRFIKENNVSIFIQNKLIKAWDPFIPELGETIDNEPFDVNESEITIRSYVLRHPDTLNLKDDTERNIWEESTSGIKGRQHQQGFYLYRGKRLIINGEWLEGEVQEAHNSYARIMVDIPNSLDKEWDLDILKTRVKPMGKTRETLKNVARKTRIRANEVYRFRQRQKISNEKEKKIDIWKIALRGKDVPKISLNREHLSIKRLLSEYEDKSEVRETLKLIETFLPYDALLLNYQQDFNVQSGKYKDVRETKSFIERYYKFLLEDGNTSTEALDILRQIEPVIDNLEYLEQFEKDLNND